jgi:hypothetical protein
MGKVACTVIKISLLAAINLKKNSTLVFLGLAFFLSQNAIHPWNNKLQYSTTLAESHSFEKTSNFRNKIGAAKPSTLL